MSTIENDDYQRLQHDLRRAEERAKKAEEDRRKLEAEVEKLRKGSKSDKAKKERKYEELCDADALFELELTCPVEEDKTVMEKSEAIEIEVDIQAVACAAIEINARGEQQLAIWCQLDSTEKSFNLTVFTELQLNGKVSFGLHSELLRIPAGSTINSTKFVVPEWQTKFAAALRGQPVKMEYRVRIVRSHDEETTVIEDAREDLTEIDVDDQKIAVHLSYLSAWSQEFSNANQSIDCSASDFREMLEVVYPAGKPISPWNVELLLSVASKLKMPELTRKCEIFLNEENRHNLSEIQQLLLADKYRLYSIKTVVLARISSTADLRSKLFKPQEYYQLSREMKSALDKRYTELHLKEVEGNK